MKKIIHWMIAATVVGALAGCARTAPIEQVNAIVSAGHTEAQVKDAIIKAGAQRQWIMSDAGPGVIKGKLQNRDHVADIKINYSATSYSIVCVSSINLMAANGKIHRNYNRWVHNLDKDIQVTLAANTALQQ
ncbi:lipoprotein [Klebsiella quasipneumoniae subsp. similipneumoniae]|uniref:LptM family lipoprotein n=1 Tax=Klebsiella quasipneumoniae TaxID=1463165 RepID=UPI003D70061D